jgi:hypothetical protein
LSFYSTGWLLWMKDAVDGRRAGDARWSNEDIVELANRWSLIEKAVMDDA